MKRQMLAVCDEQEDYSRKLCKFLQKKEAQYFETAAFTSLDKLLKFCGEVKTDIILISESMYDPCLREQTKGEIVLLGEKKEVSEDGIEVICKYQSGEALIREIMSLCGTAGIKLASDHETGGGYKMIGLYTPVHRCFQTTFALTLGQILARKYKVLYLSFESYSGLGKRLDREFMTDLSDLIYYVSHAREALILRLKGMIETVQGLDFIPPAFSYMDINRITAAQWMEMFQVLGTQTSYEYLILDLSDNMQGLFEILRECEKIFTLVQDDGVAMAKIDQYEKLLRKADYEDILDRTRQYRMPVFRNVPLEPEQMTYGDMADYIRKLVREEFDGA